MRFFYLYQTVRMPDGHYIDIGGLNGFSVTDRGISKGSEKRKCFFSGNFVLPVVGDKNHK